MILPFALPALAAFKSRVLFPVLATLAACVGIGLIALVWLHQHDKAVRRAQAAEYVADAMTAEAEARAQAVKEREHQIEHQKQRSASDQQRLEDATREKADLQARLDAARPAGAPVDGVSFPVEWLRKGTATPDRPGRR